MDEITKSLVKEELAKRNESENNVPDSTKFIIKDERASQEQPQYLENISKSLDQVIGFLLKKSKQLDGSNIDQQTDKDKNSSNNNQPPKELKGELTTVEEKRYNSIFKILGKTLNDIFNKGPEANRLLTPSINNRPDVKQILPQSSTKNNLGKGTSWLAALTALALAFNALTGNIAGTLQAMYRTLKQKFSAIASSIGRIFARIGTSITTRFQRLGSAVIRQFRSLGTTIVKLFRGLGQSIYNAIKPFVDNILKLIGSLLPAFLKNKLFPSTTVPVPARPGTAPTIPAPVRPGAAPTIPGPVTPTPVPGSAATPWYKKLPGVKRVTELAGKSKDLMINPVLKVLKNVFPSMGGARGVLSNIGKAMNSPIIRKLPIVGPLLEVFFGKGDIDKLKQQRASNQITTDDELYRLAGLRVIKGIGGLIGGAGGAIALSWIPGLGTLAGGLLGDIIGRLGSEAIANYLLPKEHTMDIGRLVVDSPIREEELQDFLVKGDRVYKFNNKDEVLGMKEGGAVNSLISSITNTNERQFSISSRQVKILEEIRDGIKSLILKEPSGNTNNYSGSRDSQPRPSLTPFNLRSEFDSMNNIATI